MSMTTNPYMPASRALPILQELSSVARRSDLLEALVNSNHGDASDGTFDITSEQIQEALKTACKYVFIQTLGLKGTGGDDGV